MPLFLFGLSMDYKVFLLSLIREDYDATGDNAASVARGLPHRPGDHRGGGDHGGVFLSFVPGANAAVKQIGPG